MRESDLIAPQHKVAGAHSARILLRNIAFAAVEAKLLGAMSGAILGYRFPKVVVTWSKQDAEISAIFPFTLSVESRSEPEGVAEVIADISIVMHLAYQLIDDNGRIPQEELPHVIGTLGYLHAWPYFRADVQWLTTKLGFPALVLPVVLSGQVSDRIAIQRTPVGEESTAFPEFQATTPTTAVSPTASLSTSTKKTPRSRKAPKK